MEASTLDHSLPFPRREPHHAEPGNPSAGGRGLAEVGDLHQLVAGKLREAGGASRSPAPVVGHRPWLIGRCGMHVCSYASPVSTSVISQSYDNVDMKEDPVLDNLLNQSKQLKELITQLSEIARTISSVAKELKRRQKL